MPNPPCIRLTTPTPLPYPRLQGKLNEIVAALEEALLQRTQPACQKLLRATSCRHPRRAGRGRCSTRRRLAIDCNTTRRATHNEHRFQQGLQRLSVMNDRHWFIAKAKSQLSGGAAYIYAARWACKGRASYVELPKRDGGVPQTERNVNYRGVRRISGTSR